MVEHVCGEWSEVFAQGAGDMMQLFDSRRDKHFTVNIAKVVLVMFITLWGPCLQWGQHLMFEIVIQGSIKKKKKKKFQQFQSVQLLVWMIEKHSHYE